MKKIISFLFILSLSFSNTCFSQSGWFWQHPYPQGNNLRSLSLNSSNGVVAVGSGGTIISTTNDGANWSVRNDIFSMKNELASVFFINNTTGWVCGGSSNWFWSSAYLYGDNRILKTTNEGANWIPQYISVNSKFNSIYFIDDNTGWCVGGSIWKTTNGGINWIQFANPGSCPLYSVFFINSQTGWISGWHSQTFYNIMLVYKTFNGGNTWVQQYVNTGNGAVVSLEDIFFINSETGWVIGTDRLLNTTNGGNNWVINNQYGNSIFFVNQTTGYLVGNTVKKTTNSGINWVIQDLIDGNEIRFFNDVKGYIVANNGRIFRTTNAGNNWNEMSCIKAFSLLDIFFCNPYIGYSVGDYGKVLKTTNSGRQWLLQNTISSSYLASVYFYNELTGWIGTSNGTTKIFKTTNGGTNWFSQLIENPSNTISSIIFANENTGFAGSSNGYILKTTNGGINWNGQSVNLWVTEIYIINDAIIIAVGNGSPVSVRKTTNGGVNWYECNSPVNIGFEDIDFINPTTGFACGSLEKICKTTDAGENWTAQPQKFGESILKSIKFLDSLKGFTVNLGGMIYYTINGGITWDSSLTYSGQLNSIYTMNDSLVWICGFNGTVLCNKDFGHEFLDVNNSKYCVPTSFFLSQNYPNPFNPVTKIRYDIPPLKGARGMMTRLIIYDILGREIETLVNESQKPGSYEVTWDGSRYASGVYFYRLYVDDASAPLSITKKMVLIK